MINMPGGPELMVIVLVALIVLGPEQLPKAMRTFGNVMAEIRKVSSGFQTEIKSAMDSFTEETDKAATGDETDKAHSATMTDAPSAESAESPVQEVVARNDGSVAADADDGAQHEAGNTITTTGGETSDRPTIDPVDRAAG